MKVGGVEIKESGDQNCQSAAWLTNGARPEVEALGDVELMANHDNNKEKLAVHLAPAIKLLVRMFCVVDRIRLQICMFDIWLSQLSCSWLHVEVMTSTWALPLQLSARCSTLSLAASEANIFSSWEGSFNNRHGDTGLSTECDTALLLLHASFFLWFPLCPISCQVLSNLWRSLS